MRNRVVLWLIITLFVISSACAGYGFYLHTEREKNKPLENINKEFKFDNKLWFYDKNYELIGTYQCQNSNCTYAKNTIDDNNYAINYYPESTNNEIKIINNRYAFIEDSASNNNPSIVLYDVVNGKIVQKLRAVKNYTIGLDEQYMIVENEDGLWGVMKMNNNAGMIIDFQYKYIGVKNEINEESNLLYSNSFIVLDNNGWKVVSDSNTDITTYYIHQIYDYTDGFVITTQGGYYFLNTSDGNGLLNEGYNGMEFISHFVKVSTTNGECYLIDLYTMTQASQKYYVSDISELVTVQTFNGIEISYQGAVTEYVS